MLKARFCFSPVKSRWLNAAWEQSFHQSKSWFGFGNSSEKRSAIWPWMLWECSGKYVRVLKRELGHSGLEKYTGHVPTVPFESHWGDHLMKDFRMVQVVLYVGKWQNVNFSSHAKESDQEWSLPFLWSIPWLKYHQPPCWDEKCWFSLLPVLGHKLLFWFSPHQRKKNRKVNQRLWLQSFFILIFVFLLYKLRLISRGQDNWVMICYALDFTGH